LLEIDIVLQILWTLEARGRKRLAAPVCFPPPIHVNTVPSNQRHSRHSPSL